MNKSPVIKGLEGELEVEYALKHLCKRYNMKYIPNAIIPYNSGVLQVDFMLFSTKGFYCLEVKNWTGEVYVPRDKNDKWKVYATSRMVPTHNPIEQNRLHVLAASASSINNITYQSYIIFLKVNCIHNRIKETGTLSDFVNTLLSKPDIESDSVIESEYNHFMKLKKNCYDDFMRREFSRDISLHLDNNKIE